MKKLLCAFIAVIMVVATCVTMVACNTGKDNTEQAGPIATVTNEKGEDITNATAEFPERMVFAYAAPLAAASEPALAAAPIATTTLRVTVVPSNATNQKMDWSAEFVNPNSTWANGKNVASYVTVTPTEANGTTATVNCLAAFGEQVKITVTSQDNPQAKAACTLDFVKRLESISPNLGAGSTVSFNASKQITYTFTYSDGTLMGNLSGGSVSLKLADALYNTCKTAVGSTSNFVFNQTSSTGCSISASSNTINLNFGDCTRWMSHTGGDPSTAREKWQTAFYNYVRSNPGTTHAFIEVTCDYTYQGTASTTKTVTIPVVFALSSVAVNVSSITLNSASITL